ncbi:MAG: hypothetical protein U5K71_16985 [Gracilimonas sp.]|nr:hypothetical protein [Gracilimonas sp.]
MKDGHFSHWEGNIEGSENPVTIEVDGEKTVTAVFERRITRSLFP